MSTPDLNWLKRCWNLPEFGNPLVERFLAAEQNGSTACKLDSESESALGNAAAVISVENSQPVTPKPLVVLAHPEGKFLQSWLYYQAEREVATDLKRRAVCDKALQFNPTELGALWGKANAEQKAAVMVALKKTLCFLTGGPGTGKTFTLTLILLALSRGWPSAVPPRVMLAAPTGKAADQMRNSIQRNLAGFEINYLSIADQTLLQEAATKSKTVHKLLGYNPSTGRCKFNAMNPLPCDLLIVDESSMTDILLWRALLRAIPKEGRLIVVGDPQQLQSVGPGDVLGELVRIAKISGSVLENAWVHLVVNMRFQKGSAGIAAMATALEKGEAEAAAQVLYDSKTDPKGLHWIERAGDQPMGWGDLPKSIQTALTAVAEARLPQDALWNLQAICILTAFRQHFIGAEAFNGMIEKHFKKAFAQFENRPTRPIIINRNDSETGLKNGTVGVIIYGEEGKGTAWFPASGVAGEAIYKSYKIAELPDYSLAWVLTVHRSQGSEYKQVLVVLPRKESPMNSRELIYTAITRARETIYIAGSLESVKAAVQTPTCRVTMIGAHFAHQSLVQELDSAALISS